jgi:hypothetical protein
VAALATGIADTISNTSIMLTIAEFFFMISPLFTVNKARDSELFFKSAFVFCQFCQEETPGF